ncbi:YjcQ family protein [Halalkalibacterium halodurans]|uniref:YjcQ family protein n=1 Tax=Halalkalibacterium halodurans TaxID=86665 RepID=UPI002E1EB840|nr:YjcQ family protein [Halalkalibacterium halodurans]
MNKKKLRYAILKEIDSNNKILSEKDFGVDEATFDEAVNFLKREGYLDGIFNADNRPQFYEGVAFLTEKGESYLEENSALAKTYRGLKEIRDWIKL